VNPRSVRHAELADEIVRYRTDPQRFIASLGSADGWQPPPALATLLKHAAPQEWSVPAVVRDHIRATLDQLVRDLRIFALSNLIGLGLVAWLTARVAPGSRRLHVQAYILFIAIAYAATVYIRQDWFFNLLLNTHLGWWYPLLIAVTSIDLWLRWKQGKLRRAVRTLIGDATG